MRLRIAVETVAGSFRAQFLRNVLPFVKPTINELGKSDSITCDSCSRSKPKASPYPSNVLLRVQLLCNLPICPQTKPESFRLSLKRGKQEYAFNLSDLHLRSSLFCTRPAAQICLLLLVSCRPRLKRLCLSGTQNNRVPRGYYPSVDEKCGPTQYDQHSKHYDPDIYDRVLFNKPTRKPASVPPPPAPRPLIMPAAAPTACGSAVDWTIDQILGV